MESDRSYFARRAEQEREAAGRTSDPDTRRAHLELAEAYEHRAAAARPDADRSRQIEEILRARPDRK